MRRTLTGDAPRSYDYDKLQSSPGYHGAEAPCLQAIPHVVASGEGVLPSFSPGLTSWPTELVVGERGLKLLGADWGRRTR